MVLQAVVHLVAVAVVVAAGLVEPHKIVEPAWRGAQRGVQNARAGLGLGVTSSVAMVRGTQSLVRQRCL